MARIPAYRITESEWLTIIGAGEQQPNALYFVEINTWLVRLYETDNAGTPNARIIGGNAHKGEYDDEESYLFGDLARREGSMWFLVVEQSTGNAPPSLPTTSNDQWELFSASGIQSSNGSVADAIKLTQAEFNALSTPDAATLFAIIG